LAKCQERSRFHSTGRMDCWSLKANLCLAECQSRSCWSRLTERRQVKRLSPSTAQSSGRRGTPRSDRSFARSGW
jgi:hypothetical protein